MFSNDVIKIKYVEEGYLPNWPYHFISDEEMIQAFLSYGFYDYRTDDEIASNITLSDDEYWSRFLKCNDDLCFFKDNYPLSYYDHCYNEVRLTSEDRYRKLVEDIHYHLKKYIDDKSNTYEIPDWVYSYMLGETLGVKSDTRDLHYMFVMLDCDNDFDEYTPDVAEACYRCSTKWVQRLVDLDHRPPTMFGEPHVIKSLRLSELAMS